MNKRGHNVLHKRVASEAPEDTHTDYDIKKKIFTAFQHKHQ